MKYRKKPVVIDAFRWMGFKDTTKLIEWAESHGVDWGRDWAMRDNSIGISTLEGVMKAMPGDWIIRGVAGEFYPCKEEIFDASYELA